MNMVSIKEKAQKIKMVLGEFWMTHYEDIMTGLFVFLLVSLAFGLGIMIGSRMLENSQITVNCPPSFWQKN